LAKIFPKKTVKTPNPEPHLVVGLIPVRAALLARGGRAQTLWVAKTRSPNPIFSEILELADQLTLSVQRVERAELDRLSPTPHQGVVAQFRPQAPLSWPDFLANLNPEEPTLLLALDHLADPHNLGALWRSAAAFGVTGIIRPKDRAAPPTQTVYKVAAGGAEVTPMVEVVNLVRALTELKDQGFWLVGAEGGQGQDLWSFQFPSRTVLILGSEGQGLSRLTREAADFLVHIPLTGPIASLNVSAAGAILMSAYRREQSQSPKTK
jgi:23S rRNA (guanosine2251-2'-O)-methyltransferase